MESLSIVLDRTRNWLRDFVIGLNLCPFAKLPYSTNRIRYRVYDGNIMEELLAFIYAEIEFLDSTLVDDIETTLVIIPNMLQDFEEFLSMVHLSEMILVDLKLEGIIQIASFHPEYQFADSRIEDITNYTNRSPYPMIHLLREDSVEAAIRSHGNTASIPERNKKLLKSMDETIVKDLSSGIAKTSK